MNKEQLRERLASMGRENPQPIDNDEVIAMRLRVKNAEYDLLLKLPPWDYPVNDSTRALLKQRMIDEGTWDYWLDNKDTIKEQRVVALRIKE